MNQKLLKLTAFLLALTGIASSCNPDCPPDCPDEYPKNISFTEYSLLETSCQWQNLPYDEKVIMINSSEELEKYIICTSSKPVIDFSKHTLLLTSGNSNSGIAEITAKNLQQLPNTYKLNIEITLNSVIVTEQWSIALMVEKLNEKSSVKLNVKTIPFKVCNVSNPLTDLPWLKEIVDEIEYEQTEGIDVHHARIYQCNYKDGIGFFMNLTIGWTDNLIYFRNCEGERLCKVGRYDNTCTELEVDFENKILIWETFPQCDFDDPLDLPWLQKMIDFYQNMATRPFKIYQCTYQGYIGFIYESFGIGPGWALYSCAGARMCLHYGGGCDEYNIDNDSKVLIWEFTP
ncbi:MAG: hypothetical protein FWD09_08125 [Lentimicrobiaceae bacterium]|nr:hypothetical protein [Lentimicrobiaceae bacterium]